MKNLTDASTDRWIGPHAAGAVDLLDRLKSELESPEPS
jgi:hypothetical protein